MRLTHFLAAAALTATFGQAGEFITNGGFETGDTSGWDLLPLAGATFEIIADANTGMFAAELANPGGPSAALIRQSGLGAGQINTGDQS